MAESKPRFSEWSPRQIPKLTTSLVSAGVEITPAIAAAMYLAFGLIMLFFSDFLLPRYLTDPLLGQVQAIKGFAEVFGTAGFIFLVTKGSRYQLKNANRQLNHQREELDVLHRVLRHNLRNKMNIIGGSAAYISDYASENGCPEIIEERCHAINAAAKEVVGKTETAQLVRRISQFDENEEFDAVTVLTDAVESLAQQEDSLHITENLPDQALIEGNPMLPKAVEEITHNAVEHNTSNNPEITIHAHTRPFRDTVQLEIIDNGPGIPAEVKDVVLEGEKDQVQHLTGVGLWFAYWVVDSSGGNMEIETDGYNGTCVRLCLPKP